MAKILVVHGPNLNLLGKREPGIYGPLSLAEIDSRLTEFAEKEGHTLLTFQSNAEHELVERIHKSAQESVAFILINAAAFTHTSIALRDALQAVAIPFIEVHISNIFAREPFRGHSFLSSIAEGVISGLGSHGYDLALQAALQRLSGTSYTNSR